MCNFITKGSSNNFGHFLMKTAFDVKIFKFQEGEGTFPDYLPLCGRPCVQDNTLRVWVP